MRPSSCSGSSEWMMPRPAVIHCTPPFCSRPSWPRCRDGACGRRSCTSRFRSRDADGPESRRCSPAGLSVPNASSIRNGSSRRCSGCVSTRVSFTPAPSDVGCPVDDALHRARMRNGLGCRRVDACRQSLACSCVDGLRRRYLHFSHSRRHQLLDLRLRHQLPRFAHAPMRAPSARLPAPSPGLRRRRIARRSCRGT